MNGFHRNKTRRLVQTSCDSSNPTNPIKFMKAIESGKLFLKSDRLENVQTITNPPSVLFRTCQQTRANCCCQEPCTDKKKPALIPYDALKCHKNPIVRIFQYHTLHSISLSLSLSAGVISASGRLFEMWKAAG